MKESSDDRREPGEIPWPIGLLFIPLLAVATLLSSPVARIMRVYWRRKERRFVQEMRLAGRVMREQDRAVALEDRKGTLIEEWSGMKGPVRAWWTEDDVPSLAPFTPAQHGLDAVILRQRRKPSIENN